jgi:hypothetical protein
VALAQLLLAAYLDAQCSCGVSSKLSKIVGGDDAELHEFPWQVFEKSLNKLADTLNTKILFGFLNKLEDWGGNRECL